jgi:hypothetical protein
MMKGKDIHQCNGFVKYNAVSLYKKLIFSNFVTAFICADKCIFSTIKSLVKIQQNPIPE